MFSILHSALAYYNSKTKNPKQNEPSKSKTRSEHLMNMDI